jgi:SAM-dependent methyltransferase
VIPSARESYGEHGLSLLDRLGVHLSHRAIRQSLDDARSFDILEVGCGYEARNLRMLLDRVRSVVGVDFHVSESVKRLPRFTIREGAAESVLPTLCSGDFDAVLLISVLEHVWEPLALLGECHRLLRERGRLLVNVPTWRGKQFLEFSAFRLGMSPPKEMDDHKCYYDERDLWPLLVRAGFRPSNITMRRHKFGLNLFAVARR